MADIRSSQNIAQVEWQAPPLIKSSQVIGQVEYEPLPYGTYTGNITFELIPESTTIQGFVYTGDVSFSLTPESGYGSGDTHYPECDISFSLIPESDVVVSIVYTGDITFELIPESDIIGDYGYEGLVNIELIPESVYAIPIPGFDWYSGYGLVDLTFLDGNPPYYVTYGDIPIVVAPSAVIELYAEHELTASGGMIVSGAGTVELSTPSVFELIASGGVKLRGKGIVEHTTPSIFEMVAFGGVEFKGEGIAEFSVPDEVPVFELTASGGIKVSGAGVAEFIPPVIFGLIALGGIRISARGVVEFADPLPGFVLEVIASGGVKVSARPAVEFYIPSIVEFEVIAEGGIEISSEGIFVYFHPLVLEVIAEGGVEVGGDYTTYIYHTWVITGLTFEPSVYSGFDFNSYSMYRNKCYGLKDDGFYLLEGDTDDGQDIHTGINLGANNFGKEGQNRLRSIRFGNRDGDDINVKAKSNSGRSEDFANLSRSRKVIINRTVFGDDIDVSIADFDKLGSMELEVVYRK